MHTFRSLFSVPFYWSGLVLGFMAAPFVQGFRAGFDIMTITRKRDLAESEAEARKRGWIG